MDAVLPFWHAASTPRLSGFEIKVVAVRRTLATSSGRSAIRVLTLGSAVLVGMSLAGCTVSGPAAGPAATSSGPAAQATSGPTLENVAEEWAAHPDDAGLGGSSFPLLMNERGTGPATFALPDTASFQSLRLILTCRAPSGHYQLSLRDAGGSSTSSISGSSCAGDIAVYGSPVYAADRPVTVDVKVPAGTDYYVIVCGVRVP